MGDIEQLPKPPVPQLDKTLDRYLASVKPVVSSAQYERTWHIVEEFRKENGVGEQLQEKLEKLSKEKENWVTHFWLDNMYLLNRQPLPVNSSAFILLPKQHFQSTNDQLRFAAKNVLHFLGFKEKIDSGKLSPDIVKIEGKFQRLCMKTYENFFLSYRRPGEVKDDLVMSSHSEHDPLHIIVACKNQFFAVQVYAGEKIGEDHLFEKLKQVTQMAKERNGSVNPVGILTTENRTTWANIYNRMLKNNENCHSLKLLESCLFVVCLDRCIPETPNYSTIRKESTTLELASMSNHVLHGSGCDDSSANRWYDKFLQVVITRDGVVGFLMEHSASEGITVLRLAQDLVSAINEEDIILPTNENSNSPNFPPPVYLKWEIDEETSFAMQESVKKMNKLCKDVDLFVLRFTKYGKEFIKSQKISPDAFVQVALQLTYYKVHRKLVSTYESASLRRFHLGRVDNIRAATEEALAWVKAMCDDHQVQEETKVKLFQACIKKHTEILKYTISGEGPDNHLVALWEIAKESAMSEVPLFIDKSYMEFLNFRLSTSQLSSDYAPLGGYGPVVTDGYGCAYNLCADHIVFCISSFFSAKETSSDFFAHSLEGSLLHMSELCQKIRQMEQIKSDQTI